VPQLLKEPSIYPPASDGEHLEEVVSSSMRLPELLYLCLASAVFSLFRLRAVEVERGFLGTEVTRVKQAVEAVDPFSLVALVEDGLVQPSVHVGVWVYYEGFSLSVEVELGGGLITSVGVDRGCRIIEGALLQPAESLRVDIGSPHLVGGLTDVHLGGVPPEEAAIVNIYVGSHQLMLGVRCVGE